MSLYAVLSEPIIDARMPIWSVYDFHRRNDTLYTMPTLHATPRVLSVQSWRCVQGATFRRKMLPLPEREREACVHQRRAARAPRHCKEEL